MGLTGAETGAVLAIDAGNSKTDVCLVSPAGELLARTRAGPFQPHRTGARAAVDVLVPAVADALSTVGAETGAHLTACLANADFPAEIEALEAALEARAWAPSTDVVNDTFALLRAGLDSRRGIAVVCGAGINCTGVLEDGTAVRFAAVGDVSGDWGGGGQLWREAMWWAARAEDGRGPETGLRTALPQHHGLDSMAALIEAVHLGTLTETQCLELTPVLFEVADSGDPVAADLVRRQAAEVVVMAGTAIRRLGVVDQPIDVVLGGGVLTADHPLLMDEISGRLAEQAPLAVVRVVDTPPVLGAALLGLDRVGASPAAKSRLRELFRPA